MSGILRVDFYLKSLLISAALSRAGDRSQKAGVVGSGRRA